MTLGRVAGAAGTVRPLGAAARAAGWFIEPSLATSPLADGPVNAAFSTLPGPARRGFRSPDRRSRGVLPRRRRVPARATSAEERRDPPRPPRGLWGSSEGSRRTRAPRRRG